MAQTTYDQVKDGEYFSVQYGPSTVYYRQDNTDEQWRCHLSPDYKAVKRPRPTRLSGHHLGYHQAVNLDQLVTVMPRLELSNPHHQLVIRTDGKDFVVTHIVASIKEANDLCEADPTIAVIDEAQGLVFLAKTTPNTKTK